MWITEVYIPGQRGFLCQFQSCFCRAAIKYSQHNKEEKKPLLSPPINKKWANNTKHTPVFQRNRKQYLTKSNPKCFLLVRHHSVLRLRIYSPQHPGNRFYYYSPDSFFFPPPFNREEKGFWASNLFVKSHTPNWELNQILNPDVWTLELVFLPATQDWFPVS